MDAVARHRQRATHTSSAVALRYQHVMAGRDQAIAAALDELVQAAANLPAECPAERPSGTLSRAPEVLPVTHAVPPAQGA